MPPATTSSHSQRPAYKPRSVADLIRLGKSLRCLLCGQPRTRTIRKRLDMWWVYKDRTVSAEPEDQPWVRSTHAGQLVADSCPHCGGISWDVM